MADETLTDDPVATMMAERGDELLHRLNADFEDSMLLVGRVLGGRPVSIAPEFEDCVRLAGEHNLPAKTVQALAMKAWLDAGNRGL